MNRGLMSATTESIDLQEGTYWTRPGIASGNCFLGYLAGQSMQIPQTGQAVGARSAPQGAGTFNTFVGYQAGNANTAGDTNTFMGYQAGLANTIGCGNTLIGYQAGPALTNLGNNTCIGYQAGLDYTTGSRNTAIGYQADESTTSGSSNVCVGWQANASGGSQCTLIGNQTDGGGATGIVALGYFAANKIGAATGGTFLGYQAGYINNSVGTTTGLGQTLVGYNTGQTSATVVNYITCLGYGVTAGASGAVAIGADSGGTSATTSTANEIAMGTAIQTLHFFGGLKGTVVTKTSNYAMNAYDFCVLSNGAASVVLPAPTSGAIYTVKNINASAASVFHNASETIDGASAIVLSAQYDSAVLTSDGTNWFVIAEVDSSIL